MALGVILAGCGSSVDKGGGVSGVSREDADTLNAARSKFETKEDPPFSADTHVAAALLAESQNRPQLAVEQYRAAIKINSRHLPAIYGLALLYVNLKDYPQAIAAWEDYIKASKGAAIGYSNLGLTQELAGNMSAAEAAYQNGIKADAKEESCRIKYGLMLARQGRIQDAEAQLSSVLPPAQVQYNLASVYEKQGHTPEAIAAYQKALQIDPGLWAAQSRLKALGK